MAGRPGNGQKERKASMNYKINFELDFKRNIYPGKFVVIEGIDGSGKTTQVHSLVEELSKTESVFATKNPTSRPIGKFIRDVLIEKIKVPPVSIQYLFTADRQMQQEDIVAHLKAGKTVISDRYFWSAIAYGMVDKADASKESADQLLVAQSLLSHYHQFLLPDLTIFLNVSVDAALERINHIQGHIKEIYEEKEKLEKISQAYEWINKQFPSEISLIDGSKSEKEVSDAVLSLVKSLKK